MKWREISGISKTLVKNKSEQKKKKNQNKFFTKKKNQNCDQSLLLIDSQHFSQ